MPPSSWLGARGVNATPTVLPVSVLCIQHIVQTPRGVMMRSTGSVPRRVSCTTTTPRQRRLGMRAWESPLQNRMSPLLNTHIVSFSLGYWPD